MMKVLWAEGARLCAGRFPSFRPRGFNPKPGQNPHPPIIFGGESEPALKRAAELGDGWYGTQYTPERVPPVLARLRELMDKAGRDFSRFEITVGLDPTLPRSLDTVRRFADAGVHRLMIFAPGFVPRRQFDTDLYPQMARFADEVIAKDS